MGHGMREVVGQNFNSRVPCGTRHHVVLSTFSTYEISTHASLAGRDRIRSVV